MYQPTPTNDINTSIPSDKSLPSINDINKIEPLPLNQQNIQPQQTSTPVSTPSEQVPESNPEESN